eukprot:TRINITY_DN6106_c0_g1_i1.p1 TRINITY_DN6106_c0_g1~~TRINITY_DN6106_c0_g1_i1.p1  ORF type:complete len:356 (+),score=82.31 TRINITY_DN6106_c0_g1_i1:264-1331(+)
MSDGDQVFELGKGKKWYLDQDNAPHREPNQTREWLHENVHYRHGDIVVTTYPKCGTTLAEQIVLLLLNGGDKEALDPLSKNATNLHGSLGKVWPESCIRPDQECERHDGGGPEEFLPRTVEWFDGLPSPRLIKTHAQLRNVLSGQDQHPGTLCPGVKYVVVTRNPLDACTSCYYHAWNPHKNGWPFGLWVQAWVDMDRMDVAGSWFSWHREWHRMAQESDQVLWLHYEQLVADPITQIEAIAEFLGIESDDELIKRVAEGSSFRSMKAAAVEAATKGGRENTDAHLRKGVKGDWRNHFGKEGGCCLLYTSDAADEEDSVDLGGRRLIKKKKIVRVAVGICERYGTLSRVDDRAEY